MPPEPSLLVLNELIGNEPTSLYTLQTFLVPYVSTISHVWMLVWAITAAVVLVHLFQEYRAHRHDKRRT